MDRQQMEPQHPNKKSIPARRIQQPRPVKQPKSLTPVDTFTRARSSLTTLETHTPPGR